MGWHALFFADSAQSPHVQRERGVGQTHPLPASERSSGSREQRCVRAEQRCLCTRVVCRVMFVVACRVVSCRVVWSGVVWCVALACSLMAGVSSEGSALLR